VTPALQRLGERDEGLDVASGAVSGKEYTHGCPNDCASKNSRLASLIDVARLRVDDKRLKSRSKSPTQVSEPVTEFAGSR
jgi:hypothetical protein